MIAVQQSQYQLESPLYDSSAFIPANYNYLNIELSSDQYSEDPPHQFIAPFTDHSVTFGQVFRGLLENTHLAQRYPLSKLRLKLKGGYKLEMADSLERLRLILCRQSASGVTVCAEAVFWEIENNAAMTFHIYNESDFYRGQINKYFLLLNNQEPFCIAIRKNIPLNQLQNAICLSLNEQYHNKVQPQQLRFFRIRKSTDEVIFAWDKQNEIEGSEVCGRILEAENEMLGVQAVTKGVKWPTVEVQSEEYLIFHIDSVHKIKLKFALIAKYRVGQLLQHLRFEHSNSLGIKIVDEIFPPWQQVQKAEKYFRTGQGNFVKNVECRLVSQREMFYAAMGMIDHFPITKQMVTQAKEGLFERCRDLAQRRIDELSKKNESIFSSADEIHPIALYTSSVDIIDKQARTSSLLYRSLNDYLRNGKFGQDDNVHKEWKYKFSATLIKSLQKIHPYKEKHPKTNAVTVFRGIRGHQLQGKIGDLYVAKEFVSSSADEAKARKFASNAQIGTILEIQCLTGRPISQYSVYEKEQEILFMPYTYFRILEKDTSTSTFYMKLKELSQHQYSSNPATEIVWVDDKLREGEKVISSLNCPMHTTFLHQLTSTQGLRKWIVNNQHIIQNPAIRVAVITNMRRKEDDKEVVDAGAKTVEMVRNQIPKAEIILYIYHVQGTRAQLQNNGINPDSVTIFNKRAQLREFIASCCAPLEEKEKEQVILETIKKVLKNYVPESHCSSQKEES